MRFLAKVGWVFTFKIMQTFAILLLDLEPFAIKMLQYWSTIINVTLFLSFHILNLIFAVNLAVNGIKI